MKTIETVTATDNTISIDDLSRITGGAIGRNGQGCTDCFPEPRNPFDPRRPRPSPFPKPSPMPFPGPRDPFGPRGVGSILGGSESR